jgi:hypothetical protein
MWEPEILLLIFVFLLERHTKFNARARQGEIVIVYITPYFWIGHRKIYSELNKFPRFNQLLILSWMYFNHYKSFELHNYPASNCCNRNKLRDICFFLFFYVCQNTTLYTDYMYIIYYISTTLQHVSAFLSHHQVLNCTSCHVIELQCYTYNTMINFTVIMNIS